MLLVSLQAGNSPVAFWSVPGCHPVLPGVFPCRGGPLPSLQLDVSPDGHDWPVGLWRRRMIGAGEG